MKIVPKIMLALIPSIYLLFLWNKLPSIVPMHWNVQGEIDHYGSKYYLILICLLPFLITILFQFVFMKYQQKQGSKLYVLEWILLIFFVLLSIIILHSTASKEIHLNFIFIFISLLFMFLGNYLPVIKMNPFIGIRTPWALKSETVWRKTHRIGGRLMFALGFILFIAFLFVQNPIVLVSLILVGTLILLVFSMFYSYSLYKKEHTK